MNKEFLISIIKEELENVLLEKEKEKKEKSAKKPVQSLVKNHL